ncbi:hypothetical protein PSET11_02233 [Arthrobacter ulcerisalmonis]|uniref:Uncharacterized protein n=1 Tax=Arthrobacter ulcerisalmonis TaxID=2483813 RepID=A0A3P5X305_9MICC|nr:hypothetical protein PSET11_02233 [Arthrobacter ulcerisalmonis]
MLRPLVGVPARRSIVALVRSDVAERTTIRDVLDMLAAEAVEVAAGRTGRQETVQLPRNDQ